MSDEHELCARCGHERHQHVDDLEWWGQCTEHGCECPEMVPAGEEAKHGR